MKPTTTNTKILLTTKSKAESNNKRNVNPNSSSSKSASSNKLTGSKSTRDSNIHLNTSQKAKSEIDSIFSLSHTTKRGDVGLSSAVVLNGESSTAGTKKKRKKGEFKDKETARKGNDEEEQWLGFGNDDVSTSRSATIRNVETVIDPSSLSSFNFRKRKRDVEAFSSTTETKTQDHSERFRDSRGTGSRRRTEEGYGIYKEDELGISEGGGVSTDILLSGIQR